MAGNWRAVALDRVRKDPKRYSAYAVGLLWIFWGSLHFLAAGAAHAQMPQYIDPRLYGPAVAFTGILEVLFGIMVMFERWRRLAALGQLILLLVFLPALVFMMENERAIASIFGERDDYRFVRLFTVLHNVSLFLWSLWILERKPVEPAAASSGDKSPRAAPRDSAGAAASKERRGPRPVTIVAVTLLSANIAGFLVVASAPWSASAPFLWAMACLAAGAAVGFLFGVPRVERAPSGSGVDPSQPLRYVPNANIEALSDWLTKIIIGVGLVEFREIAGFVRSSALTLATDLEQRPGSLLGGSGGQAFATGVILYFFFAGVIEGYLMTRMYLGQAFRLDEDTVLPP